MQFIKRFQYLFFLAIGIGLLYFAFRGQDLNAIWTSLKQADYRWVGLSLLATFICHLSRAARWNMLINALGYTPGYWNTFLAMMSGYFVNTAVPRLGEITRCAILSRSAKSPFSSILGSVVSERLIDVFMLFSVIAITILLQFNLLMDFFGDKIFGPILDSISNKFNGMNPYLVLALGFMLLFGIIYFLLQRKVKKEEEAGGVDKFIDQTFEGLLSFMKVKNKTLFVGHTLFIWLMYFFMTWLCFFSTDATSNLSLIAGFSLVGIGSLGRSVPVQAGGMGAYHWIVAQGLLLYGIAEQDGLVLATIIHAAQTSFYLIIGGISLLIVSLNNKKLIIQDSVSS